jgi:hypothetical protein
MPKHATGWMIPQRSMFSVPRHRTLLGVEIALHFLSVTGFKFGSDVHSHVAFKPESVTANLILRA